MRPPEVAARHAQDRQELSALTAEAVGQNWSKVDTAKIVDSWAEQLPDVAATISAGQLGAARSADDYLDAVGDSPAVGEVEPTAFAGRAADGRSLLTLLMSPAFNVLQLIASGLGTRSALAAGGMQLDTIARTEVADAGRIADGVSLTAHPAIAGYIRVVVGATCSRCMIMAGRWYKWNAGFQRHPRCDCTQMPAGEATAKRLIQDPRELFDRLTRAERSRAGWSLADQRAIAEGADLNAVTNAKRGVYVAGGKKYTIEGTSRRGLFGGYEINPETGALKKLPKGVTKSAPRLTPAQIYAEAGDDRQAALRMLRENGYLRAPAKARIGEAEAQHVHDLAQAYIDGQVGLDELHPYIPRKFAMGGTGGAARAAAQTVEIRPAVLSAKTVGAVEKTAAAEAKRITGRDIAFDLSVPDASVLTAREHVEGVLRALERFPDIELTRVRALQLSALEEKVFGDQVFAEFADGELMFNGRVATNASRAKYLRDLAETHTSGFSVYGSPSSLVMHEMGHGLHETIGRSDLEGLMSARVKEVAKAAKRPVADLVAEVSEYGARNQAELMGEAFADVLLNGEAAAPLSREIVDLLRSEYKAAGKRLGIVATETPAADLAKLKVAELRAMATDRGLAVPARATKQQLLDALRGPEAAVGERTATGVPAEYAARQERMRELARSGMQPVVTDLSGNMARTDLLTYPDGSRIVFKLPKAGRRDADAEELGALAADAIGARAPAVARAGNALSIEFIEGKSARDLTAAQIARLADSVEGRRIGLMDVLLGTTDRAEGNFVALGSGRVAAIDFGAAFSDSGFAFGSKDPFIRYLTNVKPGNVVELRGRLDIPGAELAKIRANLEAVGPEFERLGRANWHDQIMGRLGEIERRAGVTSTVEQTALKEAARERQAVIETATKKADALAGLGEVAAKQGSLTAEIDTLTQLKALPPVDLATLRRAAATNDPAKIQAAIDRVSKKHGLTGIAQAGDIITMRPGFEVIGGGPVAEPVTGAKALDIAASPTDLAAAERAAVDRYGGDGGYVINIDLREHAGQLAELTPKNRATVGDLDSVMARSEFARPVAVYRQISRRDAEKLFGDVGFDTEAASPNLVGKTWTDPAYTSTSVEARNPNYQAVRMRIVAPAGTRGISGSMLDSDEVLLDRGMTFRVVADRGKTRAGLRELDVEIVPARGAIPAGADVRIVRRGTEIVHNGETIQLSAPQVRAVTKAELAKMRDTAVAEAKAVLDNAPKPLTAVQLKKAGITKTGTVSKTKTVAYDPKTMEVRGGIKVPAGAKVRVVEPGYSYAYRGETVELRKPVVEAVERPSAIVRPKVDELPRVEGRAPSPGAAAKETNPGFGSTQNGAVYRAEGKAGQRWTPALGPLPSGAFEENCTSVVQAFEMRMRGYDIEAAPLDVLDRHGYAAGRTYQEFDDLIRDAWRNPDGTPHGRSFAGQSWRSFAEIDAEIAGQWPDGARGIITVGRHTFNVVKTGGKAQYVEGQFAANASRNVTALYKKKYRGSTVFSRLEEGKLIRLDDLEPTDAILEAVRAKGAQ